MDRVLAILIGFPLAILILRYRRNLKDFIGNVSFAERFFGSGGTNTLIIIIAFLVFIISIMWAAGTFQTLLQDTIGKFF